MEEGPTHKRAKSQGQGQEHEQEQEEEVLRIQLQEQVTENPRFQVNVEIPPEVSTTSSTEVAIPKS